MSYLDNVYKRTSDLMHDYLRNYYFITNNLYILHIQSNVVFIKTDFRAYNIVKQVLFTGLSATVELLCISIYE